MLPLMNTENRESWKSKTLPKEVNLQTSFAFLPVYRQGGSSVYSIGLEQFFNFIVTNQLLGINR